MEAELDLQEDGGFVCVRSPKQHCLTSGAALAGKQAVLRLNSRTEERKKQRKHKKEKDVKKEGKSQR